VADESDQEKTEDPSEYRLEEARKKGDVASSKELNSVIVLFGTVMVMIFASLYIFEVMGEYISWLYGLDAKFAFSDKGLNTIFTKTAFAALKCVAPVFAASLALGVIATVMQIGFLYAPEVLQLKFDRLNPINGAKKIFSKRALVEALKGIFKFTVIMGISYIVFKDQLDSFTGFLHVDVLQGFAVGKVILAKLIFSVLLGLLVISIGDFAWQKYDYKKKMMMTKQQLKEEMKEKDGRPEVKQRIRQMQREVATRQMTEAIKNADVVVTNPTHFSVVIKYDSMTMIAPAVVAKGQDFMALRIREIAKKYDVPLVENVPLARGLYKTVKVGEGVPRHLYKTVAEILAFVYKLKRQKKALQ